MTNTQEAIFILAIAGSIGVLPGLIRNLRPIKRRLKLHEQ